MKPGDIVYFKSVHVAKYGKVGGSYDYYFKPGDRYLIEDINHLGADRVYGHSLPFVTTGAIRNLEDGKIHFAHSALWDIIISQEEWRELQLEKLV